MGLQFAGARAVSAVSTWGLKNVFRRPAANFPGKIALYVDPRLIADLAPKLEQGVRGWNERKDHGDEPAGRRA